MRWRWSYRVVYAGPKGAVPAEETSGFQLGDPGTSIEVVQNGARTRMAAACPAVETGLSTCGYNEESRQSQGLSHTWPGAESVAASNLVES